MELEGIQTPGQTSEKRKVGFLLALGIIFVPFIFTWLLLRKGHSTTSRLIAFPWMIFFIIVGFLSPSEHVATSPPSQEAEQTINSTSSSKPAAGLALPSFGSQIVTYDKYKRIEDGMSYSQVVSIVGAEGEELSRNKMPGVRGVMASVETIMYQWMNSNGSNMNAMFQNDKLMQKAQFGLK